MELDKEKFHSWLFEKLETLQQFECVEGEISDVVEKYKTYFNFARIQKTGNGKKVWTFKCVSNSFSMFSDPWGNYTLEKASPMRLMIIRIWS